MTDLTEKWKNGELKQGWYFVKLYDRLNIVWLEYTQQDGFFGYYGNHITDYEVEQILAPVPSYEEYLTMKDCAKMVFEAAERETKLKELLKECRDLMNRAGYVFAKIEDVEKARNLLTQIDEVLK